MATDRTLIKYELSELAKLDNNKRDLITMAATKLKENYPDTRDIGAALVKILRKPPYHIGKSHVLNTLPDTYKRTYNKIVKPNDALEECLMHFVDATRDVTAATVHVLSGYRKATEDERLKIRDEFEDMIHTVHTTRMPKMSSIGQLLGSIDALAHEARMIHVLADRRVKVRAWAKVRIRHAYISHTTGEMASILGISKRWAKELRRTPAFDKLGEELRTCPKCHFDITKHYESCVQAYKDGNGLPSAVIMPKTRHK